LPVWPARYRLRIALWLRARLLPFVVGRRPLTPILVETEPGSIRPYEGLGADEIVGEVRRLTRHPWAMRDRRCLRQGLLAYRYLRLAGYAPALHFGVDRTSVADPKIKAHCWVVLDGNPILNPPDPSMVTILVYDGPESLAGSRGRTLPAVADRDAA
jgi:hypothetical protein